MGTMYYHRHHHYNHYHHYYSHYHHLRLLTPNILVYQATPRPAPRPYFLV